MNLEQRIKKRYFLIKNLEKIIADSIYYRNNSKSIVDSDKIIIANINNNENKKVILWKYQKIKTNT